MSIQLRRITVDSRSSITNPRNFVVDSIDATCAIFGSPPTSNPSAGNKSDIVGAAASLLVHFEAKKERKKIAVFFWRNTVTSVGIACFEH